VKDSAPLDEMVDGRRRIRPHWQAAMAALADLPEGGLAARALRLDRALAEDGARSLLAGPDARAAAWRCDAVPLPIPAAEFAALEAGLAQRARLLEAVLADLYGAQSLLAEGLIPPELVFANPAFLRPVRDAARPATLPFLQTYAADLLRGPDGAWRVLADRSSRAAGLGQARENRRVLARAFPDLFRGAPVRPLGPFFEAWQDALSRLLPEDGAEAGIALLTPGVTHPHWFEHMVLSRELSCALVEPGDLTVRGGALFLKTLNGLKRIGVVIRRMDGRLLDPLELGTAGAAGIPGLFDALREGSVRIVNDPGSGAAEAPALAAFLPALARRLLGEELLLPQVPTLWLGAPGAVGQVLEQPERWLIRPATDGMAPAVALAALDLADRAAWLGRLSRDGAAYAASEAIPPSVAPTIVNGALEPRPVLLRMFLLQDGGTWQALPGGLARTLEGAGAIAGGLPDGGLAKDVWVLAEEREEILGPAARPQAPLPIRRAAGELPSRVADNFFWLGRQAERLEAAARLLRAAAQRLDRGVALPREAYELAALGRCLIRAGLLTEDAAPAPGSTSALADAVLRAGRANGALAPLFAPLARLTDSLRDRLTPDLYAAFTLPLGAARAALAETRDLAAAAEALDSLIRALLAMAGAVAESMVRGGGFLFLDLGRRIERAQTTATSLAAALEEPPARIEAGLRLALDLCDSVLTYRARYLSVLQPAPALDLVLADPGNPRGLAFQAEAVARHLALLPGADALRAQAEALGAEAAAMVSDVLAAPQQAAAAALLPPRLAAFAAEGAALSDRITRRFFALLPAAQALGPVEDSASLRGAA
jgi:uncharacterized circularly permuted ATP-grasp superfamily protein/uncharacterized alpha-E superfamily protein